DISADGIINLLWSWFRYFTDGQQIELTLVENEIRFTLSGFKQFLLSLATQIWNVLTTADSPNCHKLFINSISKNSIIISNSAKRLKSSLLLFVEFIGAGYFCDGSNYNLCGKFKFFTNGFISKLMKIVLSKDLSFPGNFTDSI